MERIVSQVVATALVAVVVPTSLYAQRARGTASQQASSADTADFVENGLKFHRLVSGFMQVTDVAKNQAAGTVILQQGGAPIFAPMPGYDIKSAYEKHFNGSSAPAPAQAETAGASKDGTASTSAAQQAVAATPTTGFDAATKTVTFPDGRSVTFIDDRHLDVKLPGVTGTQTYKLEYHGS